MEEPAEVLPSVKICYELPVRKGNAMSWDSGRRDEWSYGLSREEVDQLRDMRIYIKGNWVSVEKFYCKYLTSLAETRHCESHPPWR